MPVDLAGKEIFLLAVMDSESFCVKLLSLALWFLHHLLLKSLCTGSISRLSNGIECIPRSSSCIVGGVERRPVGFQLRRMCICRNERQRELQHSVGDGGGGFHPQRSLARSTLKRPYAKKISKKWPLSKWQRSSFLPGVLMYYNVELDALMRKI